jgi:alpha,alpha-trehalose phosphorylase
MNMRYEIRDSGPGLPDKPWDPAKLMLYETLFHNANGYIGVRSCYEEGYPEGVDTIRGSYINGFYDFAEMTQAEKLYGLTEEKQVMLNVADIQGVKLLLETEEFSMWNGTVLESRRSLDMAAGYTERYVKWRSPLGREAEITIRRLASFSRPSLFVIAYSVTALNFEGNIRFCSTHCGDVQNYSNPADPRVAAETRRRLIPVLTEIDGNASFITAETVKSKLRACTAVDHVLLKGGMADDMIQRTSRMETSFAGNTACCVIDAALGRGETLTLCKYSVFTDSIRHGDCTASARETLRRLSQTDLRSLFAEQERCLHDYWERSSLEIDGDDDLAQAVAYNLYQLAQSTGRDEHGNIAAKGLSGEGYEGHFFWDTEMYIEPFFVLTNPDIARNLISYRYATLGEAKKNAALLGHRKGALFPWRTIMGRECSGFFPAGAAQYHINGDIAWSVVFYYLASGDVDFIIEKGAELVFECARLWLDTGNFHRGQFHINNVTGPDEYTCIVNNNYYTNVSAQYNLRWAVKFYELLREKGALEKLTAKIGITENEVKKFAEAAEKMYLAYDEDAGINPQDDSFLSKKRWDFTRTPQECYPLLLHYHPLHLYRHQVCKQADTVLAHFVFEDAQPAEIIKRSFLYYEGVTTHDSSLSRCIFSIVASRLGFYEKAYHYFGDSAKLDLFNAHGNTKDGIHTANMGGTYMAIVYGFAGLKVKETGLYFSPCLPKAWKACRFRVTYRGSCIEAAVSASATCFTLLSGSAQTLHIYNKTYELSDSITVPVCREESFRGISKYKAVIFDLDGVLVSTDQYHRMAWESIARELGIPFDESLNNRLRGVSRMESLEIILNSGGLALDEETKRALAEKKNKRYRSLLEEMDGTAVEPDVIPALKQLAFMGIKCAVGSSSKNARLILEKTGLSPYFEATVDGNDITRSKPDPEVFLKAASRLGVNAADALVVEDALSGIEAATLGGFDSAATGSAQNAAAALYKIKRLSDLFGLV